jgi:hypothetical protein
MDLQAVPLLTEVAVATEAGEHLDKMQERLEAVEL